MDIKNLLSFILVLVTGFCLGWFVKPDAELPSFTPGGLTNSQGKSTTLEAPNPRVENEVANPETKADELTQQTIQALQAQLEQLTGGNRYVEKDWTIDELMEALNSDDPAKIFNSNIFDFAANNPVFIDQLLSNFLSIEGEQGIAGAREILRMANRRNNFQVEKNIIDRIRLGEDQSEWISTLADFGANTVEGLSFLTERLDYQLEGAEIGNAIQAINKGSDRLFNKIPRETREQFTAQLAKQVHSQDSITRAAAISSLAAYPIKDSENVIIKALSDSERVVQYSALQTLMRGEFQSDPIRDALLNIVRDNTVDLALRASTAHTLRRYNLEGQNYDDLYNFNQELETRRQQNQNNRDQ